MMKAAGLLALVLLHFLPFISAAQSYNWANDIKSEGFDEAFDLVTDASGNTYVGGQIEYLADFGSGIIYESAGRHDIFIAKYSPSGSLIWAKRAGGKGGDKVQSLALDNFGNLFLVGEIEDSAYFESILKRTMGDGINSMFVAKYDTSGNVQWVKTVDAADSLHTRGYGAACDAQGNIYACGGIKGDVSFEGNYLFSSAGDYDASVYKFDTNGNLLWAKKMGGADSDKAYGIAVQNNNIYVTGYFVDRAGFAPGDSLNGRGGTDAFLAKFDSNGNLSWAVQAGDTGFERGWDIMINVNGDIVITGEEGGYAQFGNNFIVGAGNEDMFLAAYDANGNNRWALRAGGAEDDIGRGLTHDADGNIFVIGDFAGSAQFTPLTVQGVNFADVFIAGYDSTGSNLILLETTGGPDNDRGRGIGYYNNNLFLCGEYVDSISFGNHPLNGDSLLDIFVTSLSLIPNSCNVSISLLTPEACNGDCSASLQAVASGQLPVTYQWSSGQNSDVITNACAGNYSVTITDHAGCSSTASFNITEPLPIQISAVITDATCIGCADGRIDVSVSGGTPAYSYLWNIGEITQDLSILHAGSYSECITDANGCVACDTFTVNDPSTGVDIVQTHAAFSVNQNIENRSLTILNLFAGHQDFCVYSTEGRLISSFSLSINESFEINTLSAGAYFIAGSRSKKPLPLIILSK